MKRLASLAANIALAACGGWVATLLGIPLAWLIGAMLVTMVTGIAVGPVEVPRPLYRAGQVVVGTAVGLTVAADIIERIVPHLPAILGGALVSILIGWLLAPLLARWGALDRTTAYFAMVPAGIAEMADLAGRHGGDMGAVALFHTLRVVFIVLLLPSLILALIPASVSATQDAGAWDGPLALALIAGVAAAVVGTRLGLPSAYVVAPMLALALLSGSGLLAAQEPPLLLALAQIALGLSLGARFRRVTLRRLPRALAGGIPVVILHAALMLVLGLAVAATFDFEAPLLLMGYATGGTAEMVLTAQIVAADAALVAAYQLTRGLLGNLLAGIIYTRTVAPRSTPADKDVT